MSNWRRKLKREKKFVSPALTEHQIATLTYVRPPLDYTVDDNGVLVFNVPPGPLLSGWPQDEHCSSCGSSQRIKDNETIFCSNPFHFRKTL